MFAFQNTQAAFPCISEIYPRFMLAFQHKNLGWGDIYTDSRGRNIFIKVIHEVVRFQQ